MKIRKAKLEDLDEVVKLSLEEERHFKRQEKDDIYALKNKRSHVKIAKNKIIKKEKVVVVAEDNGKLVGYLYGGIWRTPSCKITKRGVLDDIFILTKYRDKGTGTKLAEAFFNWLKERKIKHIVLYVSKINEKAIKLYERIGFKINYFEMLKKLK
jgi:ribosomal protein S18 acetylase RimI-like enzyme